MDRRQARTLITTDRYSILLKASRKPHSKGKLLRLELYRLANELILQICDALDDKALCMLAMTCKRFHNLAIHSCLLRYDLLDSAPGSISLVNTDGDADTINIAMDVIPALRLSLSLTSVKELSCTLNAGEERLLREVRRLHALVSKLEGVESLNLELGKLDSWVVKKNFSPIALNLETWHEALGQLLNAIVDRSCKRLMIRQGNFFPGGAHHITGLWSMANLSAEDVSDVLAGTSSIDDALSAFPAESNSTLAVNTNSKPSFESFYVYSSILLNTYFCNWTFSILNASPLTSLYFEFLSLPSEKWSTILPRLTLPNLASLTVRESGVPFHDLADFLSRHSSIVYLTLFSTAPDPPVLKPRLPKACLPILTTINATPAEITNLFQSPDAFPNLEFITVSSFNGVAIGQASDYTYMDDALSAVANHTKDGLTLSLRLIQETGMEEWLQAKINGTGGQVPECVTKLELRTDFRFSFSTAVVGLLPRWLALFPSVQRISFAASCLKVDGEEKISFFKEMGERCPGLQTISIDFDEHVVQEWCDGVYETRPVTLPPFSPFRDIYM